MIIIAFLKKDWGLFIMCSSKKDFMKLQECLDKLRHYNDNGLNQFVSEEECFCFPSELKETVETFLAIMSKECHEEFNENIETLFDSTESKFMHALKEYIEGKIKMDNELSFIKKLEHDSFTSIFEYVFNNHIIQHNILEDYQKYSKEEIKVIIKLLNTFVKMIIDNTYSKVLFVNLAEEMFEFSSQKSEYIWDLINREKKELQYIVLMEKLNNLLE